jgi:hypothetical protein
MSPWSPPVIRTLSVAIKRAKFSFFSFLVIADHFRSIAFRSIAFQNFVSTIANGTHLSCRPWGPTISRRPTRWSGGHPALSAPPQSLARYFNRPNCLGSGLWRSRCPCGPCGSSRSCGFSRSCGSSRSRRSRWSRCPRCCPRCSFGACPQRPRPWCCVL